MRRLGFLIAFLLASVSAHAQIATPVFVRVYGEGTVRLRVTDMRRREACTEERERFLFDGRMSANQTMWLQSPTSCVCMTHTYGGFRDVQWSVPRTICPIDRRYFGGPYETFVRVDVPTDGP